MDRLAAVLEGEFFGHLLLALAHTLWQAAGAAVVLFLYLRRVPAAAADRRYIAAVAALAVVVLAGLLTWSILGCEAGGRHQASPGLSDTSAKPAADVEHTAGLDTSSGAANRPAIRGPSRASSIWRVRLMEAWLAGVVVMLARAIAIVIGGGRLRRRCRPLEDATIFDLIEQVRLRMAIRRKIRVLVGGGTCVPGVIGCFWPTLLLPASMMTGIPPEDLRAILTHELSHIKRYDYLVNFCQMIVEALLFFNPAVWWISRQIRIEREACCDAAGALIAGERTRYAEVLVAWARRVREAPWGTPGLAAAFGEDAGSLLDRVKRILVAGHRPRPRIPWHMALAMLALSLVCLVLARQATTLAVDLAGRILTHQQRIDRIAGISKEYGLENREYGPEDRIEVSGAVRTWDAAPLPGRVSLVLWYVGQRSSGSMAMGVTSGEGVFRTSVDYGRIYAIASAEGYGPAFAGPLETEPGGRIEGLELVLSKGFAGRIQTVDENGRPVQGVELVGGYTFISSGSFHYSIRLTTDANGIATLDCAAAEKMTLLTDVDGFESSRVEGLVLDPNETRIITLKRAQPATGIVVAEATGQPIEGAEVRILASAQGSHSYGGTSHNGAPDAVTDAQGKFELNQLRSDRTFLLFVRASGYACRYVPDIEAGDDGVLISLGPKRTIRGRVVGDLSLLPTDARSGDPIIRVANSYHYPSSGYSDESGKCPVTIRDGVGYFEIDEFWGQTVALSAGLERVVLDIEKDSLDDVVIDLRPSARRQVVLRFATPEGAPAIEGSVRIDFITDRAREQGQGMTPEWLDIEDSQARCEIPVPAKFKYQIDFRQGTPPVGYWFNETLPTRIPPGEESFVIDVPVYPAGAIYGRILRGDGSLAEDARAALMIVEKPNIEGQQAISLSGLHDALSNGVDRGTFNATPLPLGGRYAIIAHKDNVFATSNAFSLDENSPIINVDLMLPQGVDVQGRLLDADGAPARNPVVLETSIKRGEHSWSTSGAQVQPDETGSFVFTNVNPGPAGRCFIKVAHVKEYRPIRREITNLRAPVIVRLEKGLRLTGTVIDDKSGRPVPGVEVYALWIGAADG